MEQDLRVKVSRYMSYLLRHNPGTLKMDNYGFVDLEEFLKKLKERFQIDEKLLFEIVEKSERKRFEIIGNKIRALYGHSIPVKLELDEDKVKEVFYHGTTPDAASKILKIGLKPMKRRWVHFSPTIEIAREVGLRRTRNPVILEINAEAARKNGAKFYKATDKVYLCNNVEPRYIKRTNLLPSRR
ncbi:MAG: RNA 2'-phosphotransferase [Candidatus Lokiarchaeia archaeon]